MELAHLMIEMTIFSISALLALSNVFARLLGRGRLMMVGAHVTKAQSSKEHKITMKVQTKGLEK